MTKQPLTKREKSVRLHNAATIVALIGFLPVLAYTFEGLQVSQTVNAIAFLAMFCAIIVMFRTRSADEYIAGIWRSGTSAAFVITTAALIFVPFFEGVYAGLVGLEGAKSSAQSLDIGAVLIGSFFIANAWTRIRGTA